MSIVGLDLSHYQGSGINWQKMVSAGVKFVILKVTEGTIYKDDKFEANYQGAKSVGLKIGAYHFLRPSNANGQFQWFVKNLKGHVFELLPSLDVEVSGISEAFVDNIGKLLENYIAMNPDMFPYFGTSYPHPMIYTNLSLGNSIFKSKSMSRYPLWLATRNTTKPVIPKIWDKLTVWQDAVVGGKPYGIKGNVDHNFWGTFLPFPSDNPEPPPPVTERKEFTITVEVNSNKYSAKASLEKQ